MPKRKPRRVVYQPAVRRRGDRARRVVALVLLVGLAAPIVLSVVASFLK